MIHSNRKENSLHMMKIPILPCHHVVFLLLLVLQVTGQQQTEIPGQYPVNRPGHQVISVIIGMLVFMLFITLVACGICYKYRGTSTGTISDTEDGGVITRTRRTSRGLDKDVIVSFPSFLYSQVKGFKIGKGGVECAICLNEFEDEEKLRLMPPCSHVFHSDCVDVWLSSRSTCPVCRASLSLKPGSDLSLLYPPHDDIESGNSRRSVLESPDIRLLDGLTRSNNNEAKRPPRSRSTGSSTWRITELLFPRSHTTGHSLVPRGENLDRFTLHLPEEVRRQLSHMTTLPQARSSRQGYRSSRPGYRSRSVGSERRGIRSLAPRNITLSFSFSFQNAYLQSTKGKEEREIGEGSLERLRPEIVQSLH